MRTVQETWYIASDGKRFQSESACLAHEKMMQEIDSIMSELPPRPDSTMFSNGASYIQHNPAVVEAAKAKLLDLFYKLNPGAKDIYGGRDKVLAAHPSWAARLIDEFYQPMNTAWHRFYCMRDYKEYGQPYYTTDEAQAQHKEEFKEWIPN